MKNYELVLIYDPLLPEDAIEAEIKKTEEAIQKSAGKVLSVDKWGRRKLAYELKKKKEGIYTVINFQGSSKLVSDLDSSLKIQEPVLRHMIVRQELPLPKPKEEPKAPVKEEPPAVAAPEAAQEAK